MRGAGPPAAPPGGRLRRLLRSEWVIRFARSRNATAGAAIVAAFVLVALGARALAPRSYEDTDLLQVWAGPSAEHLLGTDNLGRDTLSRLLVGAQVSLAIAGAVLLITLAVGVALGMIAGYFGGVADTLIMRTVDVILAFPELIFAILLATVLGAGAHTVVAALAVVWWPGIARLTRSLVLSMRTALFIEAAVTCGTPRRLILWRHVLPNIVAPIITRASIGVGFIVTAEATLSFLGIGVQEPLPSWGGMIRDGLPALRTNPHLALFASLALGLTIIGFNLLGDGLRDLLDPRARAR